MAGVGSGADASTHASSDGSEAGSSTGSRASSATGSGTCSTTGSRAGSGSTTTTGSGSPAASADPPCAPASSAALDDRRRTLLAGEQAHAHAVAGGKATNDGEAERPAEREPDRRGRCQQLVRL